MSTLVSGYLVVTDSFPLVVTAATITMQDDLQLSYSTKPYRRYGIQKTSEWTTSRRNLDGV